MSRRFIIRPEAEEDLQVAYRYYDEKRPGLGEAFLLNVDVAMDRILRLPLLPQTIYGDVRRVLVQKFPYGIFYHVDDTQITVIAVYHARRNPQGWQDRR